VNANLSTLQASWRDSRSRVYGMNMCEQLSRLTLAPILYSSCCRWYNKHVKCMRLLLHSTVCSAASETLSRRCRQKAALNPSGAPHPKRHTLPSSFAAGGGTRKAAPAPVLACLCYAVIFSTQPNWLLMTYHGTVRRCEGNAICHITIRLCSVWGNPHSINMLPCGIPFLR